MHCDRMGQRALVEWDVAQLYRLMELLVFSNKLRRGIIRGKLYRVHQYFHFGRASKLDM